MLEGRRGNQYKLEVEFLEKKCKAKSQANEKLISQIATIYEKNFVIPKDDPIDPQNDSLKTSVHALKLENNSLVHLSA